MSINHHKCTIDMLLLQAVCNYRRSPKHRVKHGTVEWSKNFLMTGRIVEFHFRNVKWYFYFAAYINKYYSLHPKIIATIEFKIYPTKNANFELPTTKDKAISETFSQKTSNTSFTHHKRQVVFL